MARTSLIRYFHRAVLGTVALALGVASSHVCAQVQATEAELKAAIISNMLLFVEWPSRSASPEEQLTICYHDTSPVASALLRLAGKSIKGRSLNVVQLASARISDCQALYVSPANSAVANQLVASAASSPVLLIGDSAGYLQQGIMLNLALEGTHVVFDIDLRAAHRAGLQVSSKALRLARQVIE